LLIKNKIHPDFRLWLTSMPSKAFPAVVLQNGVKVTNEPPKGLKANIHRSFTETITDDIYEGCSKEATWKKLLFGLSFFHGLIQERRKFGAIGWNIPYEWNDSDLRASVQSLRNYIEEQATTPYKALSYIIGVINYGGRVTDFLDLRCITAILKMFFNPEILSDDYVFQKKTPEYYAPPTGDKQSVISFINTWPAYEDPAIFGLHSNANINFQKKETRQMYDTIISIQPRTGSGGGGKSNDEIVVEVAADIQDNLPKLLDKSTAHKITFHKTDNGTVNTLGTVLGQEIDKFNKLLRTMDSTITDLRKATKGLVVMSGELEKMYEYFLYQKIPELWGKVAYPSLKSLAPWFKDLVERVKFLRNWLEFGPPKVFWISGLYFPQGFLTGVLQGHSRRFKIPIDTIQYRVEVLNALDPSEITKPAETGVNIFGLYMEGAKWDNKNKELVESNKNELFVKMPVIWLDIEIIEKSKIDRSIVFPCPVYKVSTRAGVLSTTGQSTNYVLDLDLPSLSKPASHWVLRGVALLTTLD